MKAREEVVEYCNRCVGETSQKVLCSDLIEDNNEEYYAYAVHELLKCKGCGSVKLLVRSGEGNRVTPDGDNIEDLQSYPANRLRRRPEWIWRFGSGLPNRYQTLLEEIYSALDVNALTLAAMGARTIVDMFALDKVGDIGGFDKKLSELEKKGFISKPDRKYLGVVVDAGSAASHRGGKVTIDQIQHMMDAIEHLLQTNFVFEQPSRELRRATPRRRRRSTAKTP